jgi:hypothetical protein
MADSTQDAIIVQTCAKIAAELMTKRDASTIEDILSDFSEIFDGVLETVKGKIEVPKTPGRPVPIISQEDMAAKLTEKINSKQQVSNAQPGTLVIKNSAEQPPAWLTRAAVKKGITEVFDNRSNATSENRRPHFVSTGPDKTGFWPPKDSVLVKEF